MFADIEQHHSVCLFLTKLNYFFGPMQIHRHISGLVLNFSKWWPPNEFAGGDKDYRYLAVYKIAGHSPRLP